MQTLPAFAKAPNTEVVRGDRQRQQPDEAQSPNKDVGTLAEVDQKLLHVQPEQKHCIASDMHDHVSKSPKPQLTPDRDPPSPTSELLQRGHGQGDEQQPERRQPQAIDQHLTRVRPKGEYPGLVQPQDYRNRRRQEYEKSPEPESHQ
ncbi:hypothetical protein D3C78_1525690 [compost metagenome]